MNPQTTYLITLLIFLNSINLLAQKTFHIELRDSATHQFILSKQINAFVKSAKTNKFIFDNPNSSSDFEITLQNGLYDLTAIVESYKTLNQRVIITDTSSNRIVFYLSPNLNMLAEVVVKPKMKKFIRFEEDKLMVQVSDNPMLNTGDAFDALERTPGIMVTPDGSLSLKGKTNIIIWIDGKPTGLEGDNLAALLRSFPANSIERFEIISNPGAGYNANSGGGIINIITLKGKIIGNTYAFSTDVSKSENLNSNTSFRYNNRSKHSNLMCLVGFGTEKRETITSSDYLFDPEKHNRTKENLALNTNKKPSLLATYDNDLTDQLNINTRINISQSNAILGNNNNMLFTSNPNSYWNTISSKDASFLYQNYSLGSTYLLKEKTNRKVTMNLNYTKSNNENNTNFLENSSLNEQNKTLYSIINNNIKSNNWAYETKISLPFKKYGLNSGLSFNNQNIESNGKYNLQNPLPIDKIFYTKTLGYTFEEQVNAAFIEVSKKWKKLNLIGGMRYENTNTKSINSNGIKYFDTTYANVFPSLRANVDFNAVALDLSYSMKITRPNYTDLDPNIEYTDSYSQKEGNPFLKPTFDNKFEIGLFIKDYPLFTYTLSEEKNATFIVANAKNGQIRNNFENINKVSIQNIFCVLPIPFQIITSPKKFFQDLKNDKINKSNTNYLALFYNYNKSTIQSNYQNLSNLPLSVYGAMLNVDVKKIFTLSGHYIYSPGGNRYFQTIDKFQKLDITLSKYFLAKKLQVKIYSRDIFNTLEQNTFLDYTTVQLKSYNKTETQRFGISVLYNIGKFAFQNKDKQNININDVNGKGNFNNGVQ
ncbi:MAG: outer membrane beta-barrel protein [Pseudarcicella sp.]|nr:outer membrane beta-barrel protein [Pseudarcicella sp.]MBP6410506.1 outer membrane beta-barrel protein [Pseudarcicella sp.]